MFLYKLQRCKTDTSEASDSEVSNPQPDMNLFSFSVIETDCSFTFRSFVRSFVRSPVTYQKAGKELPVPSIVSSDRTFCTSVP